MTVQPNAALLRDILDTISLPIVVVDCHLRVVYSNKSFARWNTEFQWKADELLGRPMFEVFPFLPPRVRNNYQIVLQSGQPLRSESSYTFAGKPLSVEVELLPILSDGKVQHIITLLRNVTHQRKMQSALQESEERFRLQFKAVPVPIFTWEQAGSDFKLISFNKAAEEITEGGAHSLVGLSASRLYGQDSTILADMRTCAATHETVVREMSYLMRTTAVQKFVRAYFVFIPPNQVQIQTIDLTDIKRAEEQLKQTYLALEQKIADRTQQLKDANDQLTIERETLRRKNLIQQELLDQVGEGRRAAALQIQANIDRIVTPLLDHISGKVDARYEEYVGLIRSSLNEITSPLVSRLEIKFRQLTPQEIQICSLIRRGYSSKEIAGVRNSSVQTVLKQRKTIRKKLGLSGSDANLATFLDSIAVEPA